MKTWAFILGVIILANPVQASVKSDLIIGGILFLNGSVFRILEDTEKKKADDNREKGQTHANEAAVALLDASFFNGAAEWELLLNGQTADYFDLLTQSNELAAIGQQEGNVAINFLNDSGDHKDRQNVYKGVWIASYSVGGIMILKAGVTHLLRDRYPVPATILESVELTTVKSGGMATYSYRF